jgi:hypothetical protein
VSATDQAHPDPTNIFMSTTTDLLQSLQDSALAHAISKTNHLVGAALQVAHILGFVLLLAALLLIGFRLLGWVFRQQPIEQLTPGVNTLLWGGLVAATLSGVLMFISSPLLYASKPVFLAKLALYGLALLVLVAVLRPTVSRFTPQTPAPRGVVWASLFLWFGVAAAGRAIGFL